MARFALNQIDAEPAVTSGLENSAYGISLPNTQPGWPSGCPRSRSPGFFTGGTSLGDAQQPFAKRVNEVSQFTRRDDLPVAGRHSWKFGVDIRREQIKIAFINRPNGDFTFNGGITGNAAADFLLGLPAQFRATTTQTIQDGTAGCTPRFVQDEFRLSRA